MNNCSHNNSIPINRLHLTQSPDDLRRASRVILSPGVSAIFHRYFKYMSRIYIHSNEVRARKGLRKSWHRYHKTTTKINIIFSPPFHRFIFFRHFRNARRFQVENSLDKDINAVLLSVARRMRLIERIQSLCTFVLPKILTRFPKLRIIDLHFDRELNTSVLASLEGVLNSNKNLKLNLLDTSGDFTLDIQTNPKIFKRVQGVEIITPHNHWFTSLKQFYQCLH